MPRSKISKKPAKRTDKTIRRKLKSNALGRVAAEVRRSNFRLVELGDLVLDRVSGMRGIAVNRYDYLNGCRRFEVQPQKLKDGMAVSSITFDVGQLDVLKKSVVKPGNIYELGTGGDRPGPAARLDGKR